MSRAAIRRALPEDAAICASIKNDWIDAQDWMPRLHTCEDVDRHYREFVFQNREVWVVGDPVKGFLAVDRDAAEVTALFVAEPGCGHGKQLLDQVKETRNALELWTFVTNDGARRFYEREGFAEVLRTSGENEEGLADVLLRWERVSIRQAGAQDAAVCARIVNDWIDRTEWMPRVASRAEVEGFVAKAIPEREIWLIGEPVEGYLSLNSETSQIGALYLDRPGRGFGKALLDRAKEKRDYLQLWTHEPNEAAQRFYYREGFEVVELNPKGDDGLPEMRLEWHRSVAAGGVT